MNRRDGQCRVHLPLGDLAVAVAVHQSEEALERLPAPGLGHAEGLAVVQIVVVEQSVAMADTAQ